MPLMPLERDARATSAIVPITGLVGVDGDSNAPLMTRGKDSANNAARTGAQ
jgi:hypothetical protein